MNQVLYPSLISKVMTSTSKTGELAEGQSSGVTGNTRLPYV